MLWTDDEVKTVALMVIDMETVENFLNYKGRFVGDMVHVSIKDLAAAIARSNNNPGGGNG